jgi:hypothetical protein
MGIAARNFELVITGTDRSKDEPVEFKITDNTIVVNSSGTLGSLSSFF